ncbi:hypothetical protein ACFL6S_10885 [Candidatus Poribacteria bacterium]
MRNRPFFVVAFSVLAILWSIPSGAFDIQYPGEPGFFIGMPMDYVITADSGGDENIGQEGTFIFGQNRITIDGVEYYDSVFESPSGPSHFYFGIDPVKGDLTQKGLTLGATEIDLETAVTAVHYPLSAGDSWTEETNLTAKELEIPGLGKFPIPLSIKGVKVETTVSSMAITVPAGDFDTLLVESTYNGSLLGIPITLVQRTWLSESNITIRRSFELLDLPFYDIELSRLPPSSVSGHDKTVKTWASIKVGY